MTPMPLINNIKLHIVNPLIGFLFVAAMFYFMWGLVDYLRDSGNAESRTSGARHMLWGLVGIFIMASVVGILNVICLTIDC